MDDDYAYALQLQESLNYAAGQANGNDSARNELSNYERKKGDNCGDSAGKLDVVNERWELLDPSPDVRALFIEFNTTFFWGRLDSVEVRWSPRMTLCAGVCVYEGHGGLCSVRLSSPLLKLRPRKDLVETLLHEMIHAYLFVTQNNRDHDAHGPEFLKHMHRINNLTGAHLSVYHNFHDEVNNYRQHWWKCDGVCQHRKPYFGLVRRAMNRAPSACDPWWPDHQRTCGGTYHKIKEPEGYRDKKNKAESKVDSKLEKVDNKAEEKAKPLADIRNSFKTHQQDDSKNGAKGIKIKDPTSDMDRQPSTNMDFPGSGVTLGGAASGAIVRRLPGIGTLPVRKPANHMAHSQSAGTSGQVSNQRTKPQHKRKRSVSAGMLGDNRPPILCLTSDSSDSEIEFKITRVSKPTSSKPVTNQPSRHRVSHSESSDSELEGEGILITGGQRKTQHGASTSQNNMVATPKTQHGASTSENKTIPTHNQLAIEATGPSNQTASESSWIDCPACGVKVEVTNINIHLDTCLK